MSLKKDKEKRFCLKIDVLNIRLMHLIKFEMIYLTRLILSECFYNQAPLPKLAQYN